MSEASIRTVHARKSRVAPRDELAATTWQARVAARWRSFEQWLAGLSDRLNPILVKETRQTLRSWQFMLTFVLLLVACWVATMGGVALIGPSIYYSAGGGELLRAYFAILSLALLVVVPFAAFRSLATEREDNTYDLLSITTLRPRQIIGGKLASAVVQVVMFVSATTPCLAFTYLLRGVDAPTIALLLAYTIVASLALSMAGLLLATLARQGYGQMVLSVAFVAVLLYVFKEAQSLATDLMRSGFELYSASGFWITNLWGALFYVATFVLTGLAAAVMITPATENRSTPLRMAMLAQQAVFVGWMAYLWLARDHYWWAILYLAAGGGCYWFALGTMFNGEQAHMSRRVMRRLPQSGWGRVLFTWLNPGPSTGYMFAVANVTTIVLLCLVPTLYFTRSGLTYAGGADPHGLAVFLVLGWSYVVAYLGLGRLVVALLRKITEVTMLGSVLLHLLLVLAGSGIPTSIQWMSLELQNELYSYLQVTNPIWTLQYILQNSPTPEEPVLLVVVLAAAICALLLNLPGIIREFERTRTALPARVAEDEAELHPAPVALPQNPWDEAQGN